MTVFEFRETDRKAFLTMCEDFFGSNTTLKPFDRAMSERTFDVALTEGTNLWGYIFRSAETEEAIGYALVSSFWCNDEGGTVLLLDELYTLKESRCLGVATRFIEWLQEQWRGKAAAIVLDVLESNAAARQMYEHEGFRQDDYVPYIKYI